jgi:RIO kinase 1
MEFIGKTNPAPMLKDGLPKNKKDFFEKIINNIRLLYKNGLVHADLSEHNILNFDEQPVFIDFSQATITENPQSREFLERDVRNVCNFFKKHIEVDEKETLKRIVAKTKI